MNKSSYLTEPHPTLLKSFQVDDLECVKTYFGLFKKPTDMEMLDAISHNAHNCIAFMSKRFFNKNTYISPSFIQTAAAVNRVDVLRSLRRSRHWDIYTPALGLDTPHCGLEAAHFLLDQWEGRNSLIVQNWTPEVLPYEIPVFLSQEDGPFTAARLSTHPELFERLMAICKGNAEVRGVVQHQLLETTRSKYSHLDFDAIFTNSSSDVLFADSGYCFKIIAKSLNARFPTPLRALLEKPKFRHVAIKNFEKLCGFALQNPLQNPHINDDVFWSQVVTLSDLDCLTTAKIWANLYTQHPTGPIENKLHNKFVDYNPHAIDILATHDFEWDSTSVVGAAVMRHKLKTAVVDQGTTALKRKI